MPSPDNPEMMEESTMHTVPLEEPEKSSPVKSGVDPTAAKIDAAATGPSSFPSPSGPSDVGEESIEAKYIKVK